jgi:hypothetical protein
MVQIIRAGAHDPPPLDDYRLLSGLYQVPGRVFSAFAAVRPRAIMGINSRNHGASSPSRSPVAAEVSS